jgi:hypothetical protein
MMDIVVTIPKNEYTNDDKENDDIKNGSNAFWTLSKKPTKLLIGDRVYFVKNKSIQSSMKVIDILTNSQMQCDTTDRTWIGNCQIVMDDFREENLPKHIKGFQGFRYRWW